MPLVFSKVVKTCTAYTTRLFKGVSQSVSLVQFASTSQIHHLRAGRSLSDSDCKLRIMGCICTKLGQCCIAVGTCNEETPPSPSSLQSPTKSRTRKSFSEKMVRAIHAKTDGCCLYCNRDLGAALQRIGRWNVEHSKPWSEQGSDHISNLFASCYACNSYRSNRPVAELFQHPKFVAMNSRAIGRRCQYQAPGSATICIVRFLDVAHSQCPAHRVE